MGAAAVFETAAETPPTTTPVSMFPKPESVRDRVWNPSMARDVGARCPVAEAMEARRPSKIFPFTIGEHWIRYKRTQKVDHEALLKAKVLAILF